MNHILTIFSLTVVIVATTFVGIHEYSSISGSGQSSNVAPPQTFNQGVRSTINYMLGMNFYSGYYNNVSVNLTNISNSVMNRFYVLENNTSFISFHSKYPSKCSIGAVFSFNSSSFNKSDPLGLNLDCFYFTFGGRFQDSWWWFMLPNLKEPCIFCNDFSEILKI